MRTLHEIDLVMFVIVFYYVEFKMLTVSNYFVRIDRGRDAGFIIR